MLRRKSKAKAKEAEAKRPSRLKKWGKRAAVAGGVAVGLAGAWAGYKKGIARNPRFKRFDPLRRLDLAKAKRYRATRNEYSSAHAAAYKEGVDQAIRTGGLSSDPSYLTTSRAQRSNAPLDRAWKKHFNSRYRRGKKHISKPSALNAALKKYGGIGY